MGYDSVHHGLWFHHHCLHVDLHGLLSILSIDQSLKNNLLTNGFIWMAQFQLNPTCWIRRHVYDISSFNASFSPDVCGFHSWLSGWSSQTRLLPYPRNINNNNNNSRDKWKNADCISHHSWSSSQTSSFSFLELAATHRTPPQVTCLEGPGNMLIEFKRFAVNSKADGNNNLWFGSKRYPWQGKVSICMRDFIEIAGQMLLVFSISTYRTALLGENIP